MALHKILLSDNSELANIKSVVFRETTNNGVDLRPGCVSSSSIEVTVYGAQTAAVSVGDELRYYIIDTSGTETLIGKFYAEPTIKSKNTWGFTAHDSLLKLNADFSEYLANHQSDFPMTVYDIVSAACSVAGVTLGTNSWSLSTRQVQAFYATGVTCRDILSYAAEIGGYYVKADTSGKATFGWYSQVLRDEIAPTSGTIPPPINGKLIAYKQDGLSYANYTTAALDGVAVFPSGTDDAAYIKPNSASGNLMEIKNNLLLVGADASFFNAVASTVYLACSTFAQYKPTRVKLFPRETPFRAGQRVTITDIQGVSFSVPLMSLTLSDSSADYEATGEPTLHGDSNEPRKSILQLAADTVRINKLKVDWADIDQAIINVVEANELKSSDFVPANDGIYAKSGMEINLANKTIKATDFAVGSDGKLYADSADISGFAFQKSVVTSTVILSAGTVQDGYTMYGSVAYRSLQDIVITNFARNSVDAIFEYYDNGTLAHTETVSGLSVSAFNVPLYTGTADSLKFGLKLQTGENPTVRAANIGSFTPIFQAPANAQVYYGGNITIAGNAIIDGVTVDSSFLNSLIPGQKATVSAGGSNTINIGLDTRGVLFTSSRSTAHRGAYLWVSAPSGNFVITPILTASSLNITGASGVMTITSTASSGYAAYALCISF